MLQVREAQQDHDRRRFKFSGRDFVSYFIELLYFCKKYVIISGYILGIMSGEQTLYQRRFVLSESETKTISNRAHPRRDAEASEKARYNLYGKEERKGRRILP